MNIMFLALTPDLTVKRSHVLQLPQRGGLGEIADAFGSTSDQPENPHHQASSS